MIKTVTRHGILLSDALPHTYMSEIEAAMKAVRSKWTADFKKAKTPAQRRADVESARKVFDIFNIDTIHDFVMIHTRHKNPVRTSPGYVIAMERPPILQGMSDRDIIIQSITDTLDDHYFVYDIVPNYIAKILAHRAARTGGGSVADKKELDYDED